MSLTEPRIAYKPFAYPWAYDAWKTQQQVHWFADEVPLGDDVKDFHHNLDANEVNLVTQIFRFFTQADIEVNNCYHRHYSRVFEPTEVKMMLSAFSNSETIHTDAYSHLLTTVGMPDTEYGAFLEYAEMKAKHDYMQTFSVDNSYEVAKTLATFGAFIEGLQLFASFAILMNFPRFNKMKGMGQIVTWSIRDETLHSKSIIKLYHTWLGEHPEVDRVKLELELVNVAQVIVGHEDAFIDLAFELGDIKGLTRDDMKRYIRFIADERLRELGIPALYGMDTSNPLTWLDSLLSGVEHANFFEARSTEYSRAATRGKWEDVYS